jgi:hypothetical protein
MDSIVRSITQKFQTRSEIGKKKYGTDLDREDLSVIEWLTHFQEELMDGILYAEKLKQVLIEKNIMDINFEKDTFNSKKSSTD